MAFLENMLQSVNDHSVFLAIYDNRGYMEQFKALCARFGSHIVIPCGNIETALQFDAEEMHMDYIFIDSTLARLDRYNFMKLAEAKYQNVHIFVTCASVTDVFDEDEINNMRMEAKNQCGSEDRHSFLIWLDVRDYDATQTDAFDDVPPGTMIFSDVFKPLRIKKPTYFMYGNAMDQISCRLASFRNPALDDSKVTGVSTELSLGLPENSNDSNKRKRNQ